LKRLGLAIALLLFSLVPLFSLFPTAAFGAAATPVGDWLTAGGGAVIHIAPCGAISGMRFDHPGDPMPLDWQGNPQCGLTIVQTTSETTGSNGIVWQGVVLDPRNGVSHPALLSFDTSGNLVLRGYLLIPLLGESTTWTAYKGGKILPKCHLPS
jgi:uncharacterized protein (DUF2147 family)